MNPKLDKRRLSIVILGVLSGVLLLSQILLCVCRLGFLRHVHKGYYLSTWLINYRGGFVRRGLPGEILWWIHEWTGINPEHVVIPLAMVLFVGVVSFIIRMLAVRRMAWWLVPMSFFLGGVPPESTDVLILAGVMALPFVYRKASGAAGWCLPFVAIGAAVVLVHEISFFLFVPYFALLALRDRALLAQERIVRLLMLVPMSVAFVAVSFNRGSPETVSLVRESWSFVDAGGYWRVDEMVGLNAVSPAVADLFRHVWIEAFGGRFLAIPHQVWVGLALVAVLYVIVTTLPLPMRTSDETADFRRRLLVAGSVQFVALLPVLVFFSDLCRFCSFWVSTSVVFALMFPLRLRDGAFAWLCLPGLKGRVFVVSGLLLAVALGFHRGGFVAEKAWGRSAIMRVVTFPAVMKAAWGALR